MPRVRGRNVYLARSSARRILGKSASMASSTHDRSKDSDDPIEETFFEFVNMTPHALEAWLETSESREVGIKASESSESTGHASGRNIVKLLKKKKTDYTEADRREMHRVTGYIKRHLAQRPTGDVEHTRWASSLKNWGHDPAKR